MTGADIQIRVAETVVQIPIERPCINAIVPITADERETAQHTKRTHNPLKLF